MDLIGCENSDGKNRMAMHRRCRYVGNAPSPTAWTRFDVYAKFDAVRVSLRFVVSVRVVTFVVSTVAVATRTRNARRSSFVGAVFGCMDVGFPAHAHIRLRPAHMMALRHARHATEGAGTAARGEARRAHGWCADR